MDYEVEKLRSYAMARAVADACVLPSCGVPAVDSGGGRSTGDPSSRSDSEASRQPDPDSSAWPEPYGASGDADADAGHANRDLQAVANRDQTVRRGERDMGAVADLRGDRRPGVQTPDGEPVRREGGGEMRGVYLGWDGVRKPPREAADALVREAQERGEYEPLSSVPDLIDGIRRERDALRVRVEQLAARHDVVVKRATMARKRARFAEIFADYKNKDLRARVKELEDQIVRMKRGYE